MKANYVLGIETSCDETSAAVVRAGQTVLSNCVVSSLNEHVKFGGVIPEIASRRQLEYINSVTQKALDTAKVNFKDIKAIAYTRGPGLVGSLLVGISFARAMGLALRKPVFAVDHIQAHLYANFLHNTKEPYRPPQLPAVGLVVSGGHTSLYLVKNFRKFQPIGHTLDDAAGEAFDKVARILELGYPGGPAIDLLAKTVKNSKLHFTCAQLPDSLNFSFSGIKTAVLYHYRDHKNDPGFSVAQTAYAFQKSVVEVLVTKSFLACRKNKVETLLIGGGVAANSLLRQKLQEEGAKQKIKVYFPPMPLCLDNAAMVAGLGYHSIKKERAL